MQRNKHRWWWIVLQTTIQLRNRRNLAPRWLSSRAMHAWGELRGLRSQRIMVDYNQLASTGSWRFFFWIVIITKVDYYYCQYRRKHHHLRENTLQHSNSQLSSSWKIETEVDKKKINTICSGSNWTTLELFSKSIAKGSADDHNNTLVQCCGRAYCLFNGLTVERVQLTCCSHTVDRNLQCSFPRWKRSRFSLCMKRTNGHKTLNLRIVIASTAHELKFKIPKRSSRKSSTDWFIARVGGFLRGVGTGREKKRKAFLLLSLGPTPLSLGRPDTRANWCSLETGSLDYAI